MNCLQTFPNMELVPVELSTGTVKFDPDNIKRIRLREYWWHNFGETRKYYIEIRHKSFFSCRTILDYRDFYASCEHATKDYDVLVQAWRKGFVRVL